MGNIAVAWRSAVLACSLAALTACGGGSNGQGQDNSGAGADTPSTPVPTTAPTIGAGPQPQSATVGQVLSFGVTAGGTAPLACQWLRDGVALAGAEAATYSVTAAEADHGAAFSVRARNAAGQVSSATAVLTVLMTTAPPTVQLASGARLGAGNDGAAGFSLALRADGRVLA